jgi:hypothetical protein
MRRSVRIAAVTLAFLALIACPAAAAGWSSPGTIGAADEADAAMSTAGGAVLVWSDKGAIRVALRPPRGAFGTPATLSPTGGTSPRVALDGSGRGVITWVQHGSLALARVTPAGVSPVVAPAAPVRTAPDAAVFADGSALIAWDDYGEHQIKAALLPADGSFGPVTDLSRATAEPGEQARSPRVAVGLRGDATVTWVSLQIAANLWLYRARAAIRPPGGPFGAPELFANTNGPSDTIFQGSVLGDAIPVVGAPGDAHALISSTMFLPGFRDTEVAGVVSRPAGGGSPWPSAGVSVHSDGQPDPVSGDLASSADGVFAVLGTAAGGDPLVSSVTASVRRTGASTFTAPFTVDSAPFASAGLRDARVAPLRNGRLVVAYRRGGGLRVAVGAPGAAFAITDLAGAGVPEAPVVAAAGGSEALTAWLASSGGGRALQVAVYDDAAGSPSSPAADRTAPSLTRLAVVPRRFSVRTQRRAARRAAAARGGTITWRLSEAASVTLRVDRTLPGRRRAGRCVARSARGRTCSRHVLVGAMARKAPRGTTRMRFGGFVRGRPLRPGAYRLSVTAKDAAGNRSATRRVAFVVVR